VIKHGRIIYTGSKQKFLKRINILIKDIQREPFAGLGKPEQLKHQFTSFWSRRITDEYLEFSINFFGK